MARLHERAESHKPTSWRDIVRLLRRMTPKQQARVFGQEMRSTQANPEKRGIRVFPKRRARTS